MEGKITCSFWCPPHWGRPLTVVFGFCVRLWGDLYKGIGIGWSPIGNEVCIPLIKAEAKQVQSSTIILGWNNMKEHNMSHHQPEVWYNHGSWEQFQTPIFMHGYPGSFWKDSPTTPAFAPYRDRLHQRTGRPGWWKVEREPTFSSLGR